MDSNCLESITTITRFKARYLYLIMLIVTLFVGHKWVFMLKESCMMKILYPI